MISRPYKLGLAAAPTVTPSLSMEWVTSLASQHWFLFIIGGALNLGLIALGWVKGPLATWWTITGVAGLGLGAYGFWLRPDALK